MSELTQLNKVVLVVETGLEKRVVQEAMSRGAKGYTSVYCFGGGRHGVPDDIFAGSSQVRIEIVTSRKVAESIIRFVLSPEFASRPIAAYMETVEVLDPSHYV